MLLFKIFVVWIIFCNGGVWIFFSILNIFVLMEIFVDKIVILILSFFKYWMVCCVCFEGWWWLIRVKCLVFLVVIYFVVCNLSVFNFFVIIYVVLVDNDNGWVFWGKCLIKWGI